MEYEKHFGKKIKKKKKSGFDKRDYMMNKKITNYFCETYETQNLKESGKKRSTGVCNINNLSKTSQKVPTSLLPKVLPFYFLQVI